ncbi:uncharacterized protein LOC141680742 [Apium graveolens]|uniref:uncharacterized protein LOC141680742 n=1 Tax=Apium graveolens TaxID=4045 RepID=UPI003D7B94D0
MGFSSPFISWIKACICTTKFSIKLNDIVHGYFDGAQGIRQGDHLSPYLFTICINVLCCLLKPKPPSFKYHWKCKHLNITHMFFADDVLFFSHANVDSVKHIMNNIVIFSSMSGLQPSIHKSNSFFCNASPEYFDWFDNDFAIPRGCLPVKFLGVSSIYGQLCLNDYIPLINKITARIHNWTSLLLSFAGRVRLLNSVVHAIEAYRCNHFLLPTAFITYDIENGCNTSLWFDPWWEGVCLVSTLTSPIIRQCGLSSNATIGVLLQTGHWALPTPNSRHHHVDPLLRQWLEHFSFPVVHVHREDRILLAGIHAIKIKTWNIWDSIRNRGAEIRWDLAVWHKLTIYRYAHHQWVACHGRLPNFAHLARFGIAFSQICYLCIGGLETDNHLLRHCPYSVFVLWKIRTLLHVHILGDSWLHCLQLVLPIEDRLLRTLSLYCLQIFCYHIWRERKARAHDKSCFGSQQHFDGIVVDFKA